MTTTYDLVIDKLAREIDQLAQAQKMALFSAIAGALLDTYRGVQERTGTGNVDAVEAAIAASRKFVLDGTSADWQRLLEGVELATPHGDDLDAPDSTYEQDAAICADIAIRYAMADKTVSAEAIEYALEPIKTVVCLVELDRLDPGSGAGAQRWYDQLPSNPKMKAGIEGLQTSVRRLQTAPLTAALLDDVAEQLRVLRP